MSVKCLQKWKTKEVIANPLRWFLLKNAIGIHEFDLVTIKGITQIILQFCVIPLTSCWCLWNLPSCGVR